MDTGGRSRVVVASDAFKGSLTSLEVADAVRLGLLDAVPGARVTAVAVADGGEGTVAAALSAGWSAVPVPVHGPTGEPVAATIALRGSQTALVELADACGLARLPAGVPAPLTASSRGLGDALRAALDLGVPEVVVGVGGSASTDGGAGLLAALGARLLDAQGRDLPDGGAALADLAHLDLSGLDARLRTIRLVLAADVDSPLLGPSGAAAVFGPQKGATPHDVSRLERALSTWAAAVERAVTGSSSTAAGAGAAGGAGFALISVLGAELRPGVDVVLDLVGLDAALGHADLVVTGEGSLDAQTLAGKAVGGVARRAAAHGIPVVAVCGRLALDGDALARLGLSAAYPLSDLQPDAGRSISDAATLLRRTGSRIASAWLSAPPG